MGDPMYLTAEGAARLRIELAELKGTGRDDLAKRLRSAIQMGDLSENADYHAAKEQQGFLEGRIQELEYLLKNAIIVESVRGSREVVDIGAYVTVQEDDFDPETFQMVGVKEADSLNQKISNDSPFGRALMGGRVGDEVVPLTPRGEIHLKILKIE